MADPIRKAKALPDILRRIAVSLGEDGLGELLALYPNARFYWTESHGLAVFWPGSERGVPQALMYSAGFIEDLLTGEIRKDKVGGTGSMAEELVEDLDVVRVMTS